MTWARSTSRSFSDCNPSAIPSTEIRTGFDCRPTSKFHRQELNGPVEIIKTVVANQYLVHAHNHPQTILLRRTSINSSWIGSRIIVEPKLQESFLACPEFFKTLTFSSSCVIQRIDGGPIFTAVEWKPQIPHVMSPSSKKRPIAFSGLVQARRNNVELYPTMYSILRMTPTPWRNMDNHNHGLSLLLQVLRLQVVRFKNQYSTKQSKFQCLGRGRGYLQAWEASQKTIASLFCLPGPTDRPDRVKSSLHAAIFSEYHSDICGLGLGSSWLDLIQFRQSLAEVPKYNGSGTGPAPGARVRVHGNFFPESS
ncbi:hypothetical protein B0H13DRAFT_1865471 [Mycena leptocephala]|nr:hypothetical protein B0H13DRAFT_1865471 [Mycena leptocephala]